MFTGQWPLWPYVRIQPITTLWEQQENNHILVFSNCPSFLKLIALMIETIFIVCSLQYDKRFFSLFTSVNNICPKKEKQKMGIFFMFKIKIIIFIP